MSTCGHWLQNTMEGHVVAPPTYQLQDSALIYNNRKKRNNMGTKYNIYGPTRGMLNTVHMLSNVVKVIDDQCR